MTMKLSNDLGGLETEEIWEEARRIRRLRPEPEQGFIAWGGDHNPEKKLTESVIKQAVEDVKSYCNDIIEFDSFADWLTFQDRHKRNPITKGMKTVRKASAVSACKALLWISSGQISDSFHFSFSECVEMHTPGCDVDFIQEQVLQGPCELLKLYPRIADGLRWAGRYLDPESTAKYRRYLAA